MQKLTVDEVRDQLTKILSSSKLSASNILSQFLYFIVNETLAGKGEALKEYTIGVHALKKGLDFNPQVDSIVRIHAGRLRRALKEYYYEEGTNDPIVIIIPKGNYIPIFELRAEATGVSAVSIDSIEAKIEAYSGKGNGHHLNHEAEPHLPDGGDHVQDDDHYHNGNNNYFHPDFAQKLNPQLPKQYFPSNHKPAIAVLPFKKIGSDDELKYFTRGISEYLSTELTHFKTLKVVSYFSSQRLPTPLASMRAIGITVGADYLITGSVQRIERRLRVCVQLNSVEASNQLWAHTFDQLIDTDLSSEFLEEVVERVLAALTGVEGVIARYENSKKTGPAAETYRSNSLTYWYSQYRMTYDKSTIQKAKRYYQEVIKNEPENVAALAFLSEILNGEMFLAQSVDENTLKRSYDYALTAVKIDPYYQQGYFALAVCHQLSGKIEECVHVLEQGLEINPKSPEYKGAMGGVLILAGKFEWGSKLLTNAIKLNVHLIWWQTMSLGYYAYHEKRYHEALVWAERTNRNLIWVSLLKAASHAQLDQLEEGKMILDQMREKHAFDHLSEEKLRVIYSSETILAEILGGLKKLPYMFSPSLLALAT